MTSGFGAFVRGADLPHLAERPESAAQVRAWLDEHHALVLTGVDVDPETFVALAGTLGPVRPARVRHPSLTGPAGEHLFVSVREGTSAPRAAMPDDAGHVWHVDYTFVDPPPRLSMLYAKTAPEGGSRTWFADMTRVYDALPAALKARIDGLQACHYSHPQGANELTPDTPPVALAQRQQGVRHPLVMRDPRGTPFLCLPARPDSLIDGLDEAQSRALLDALWPYVFAHGQIWDYELRSGEILVWNNQKLMHKRSAWPTHEERLLWFLTTQ